MSVKAFRCSITWDLKLPNNPKNVFSKNNFKYIRISKILIQTPRTLRASAPKHTQNHRYVVGQIQQEGTLTSRTRAACKWSLYAFL